MSIFVPQPISLLGRKGKNIFRHHIRHHHKVELEFILFNSFGYSTNSDSASPPKFSIGDYQSHPMKS